MNCISHQGCVGPCMCLAHGVCAQSLPIAAQRDAILMPPPLILRPLTDWRANPTPYPLRDDTHARAVWPQGLDS